MYLLLLITKQLRKTDMGLSTARAHFEQGTARITEAQRNILLSVFQMCTFCTRTGHAEDFISLH